MASAVSREANWPVLKKLLKAINEGDTLVAWKLDRLGRSMRNLVLLVNALGRGAREKGRIGGRCPELTSEQWAQAGRLIANGADRKQVAIIYDVSVCTLYKKFPIIKPLWKLEYITVHQDCSIH